MTTYLKGMAYRCKQNNQNNNKCSHFDNTRNKDSGMDTMMEENDGKLVVLLRSVFVTFKWSSLSLLLH